MTLQSRHFKFCVACAIHYVCLGYSLPVLRQYHCCFCLFSLFHYLRFLSDFICFFRQFFFWLNNFIFVFSLVLILIQLHVQIFYYYCTFVHYFPTSTSALVRIWILFCCIGSSITISLAWVSGWTVTDYLFAAGWRLFKHLLSSATESGALHCSLQFTI